MEKSSFLGFFSGVKQDLTLEEMPVLLDDVLFDKLDSVLWGLDPRSWCAKPRDAPEYCVSTDHWEEDLTMLENDV